MSRPRYITDPRPVDIAECIAILRQHNAWRRFDGDDEDGPQACDPREIGRAIDMAVAEIIRLQQEVTRLKNKVNATFDAIHEHTSRAATKRIFAAVKDFDPAVGGVNP